MRDTLPDGTKRTLLDLLLKHERTAEDLATGLGVSATAVRQHLATLTGSGIVERRKADTATGRPAYLYRLTDLGRRLYPKRHDLLLRGLVDAMLARQGRQWTLTIVSDVARALADAAELPRGKSADRWRAALAWLEAEFAWEADVEDLPGGRRRVVLHQCPFRAVSVDHPAVCGAFFCALLDRLTEAGPFAHRPIGDGLRCCALESSGPPASTLDTELL